MKKIAFIISFVFIITHSYCQDMGLSFSYFIPKNGSFSVPISPFSIRGIGFDLTRNFAVETGFSLYRISGMNIKDLPFKSEDPLIGSFFSIMVPLEGVITFDLRNQEFKIKGGGFAFYNLGTKIDHGNLDRALKEYLSWQILNSDYDIKNYFGIGYRAGVEYIIYLNKKMGVSFEAYYMSGDAPLDMEGSYSGVPQNGDNIITTEEAFPDAKLDYTGLEFSIGILFTP